MNRNRPARFGLLNRAVESWASRRLRSLGVKKKTPTVAPLSGDSLNRDWRMYGKQVGFVFVGPLPVVQENPYPYPHLCVGLVGFRRSWMRLPHLLLPAKLVAPTLPFC
ncbi:hypothetical protein GW17_00029959 [Ensete ventricosum]|nr:hypothetical protein GW17_00029959 [Ensete ventricosum]